MRGVKIFLIVLTLLCSSAFASERTFKLQNGLEVELLGIVRDTEDMNMQDFIAAFFLVHSEEDSNLKVSASSVFNNIGHEFDKVITVSIAGHGREHEIIGYVPTLVWFVHYVPLSFGELPVFSRMKYNFNGEDLNLRREQTQNWYNVKHSSNEILQEWLKVYPDLSAFAAKGEKLPWHDAKVFAGHHYKAFYDENLSWQDAQNKCDSMGGHLAAITSSDEQAFIRDNFDMTLGYWIGGFLSGDKWQWITGEQWNYTNWAPGKPKNGDGYHLGIWNSKTAGVSGGWGNFSNSKHYICEWDF